jgi:lipopolysaccharide heptosyltransferase II
MRFIDRRLGVPFCFLLSCLHGIRKVFSHPKRVPNPESILFIELSEMGSMVLAYSLFQKTKELFPDAKLYFLTFKENRYAVDILGIIPEKNVITLSSRSFLSFLFSAFGAVRKLRKRKIRVAVDMELFARLTAILSYLSGAQNRVGYFRYHSEGLYRGNFLTHQVAFNPHIHMAQNLLNLVYAITSPPGDLPLTKKLLSERDIVIPKIQVAETDKKKMFEKLQEENANIRKAKRIVLLNPNASDIVPLRRWPIENYIELAKRFLKHKGVHIIITGVESEREPADALQGALRSERCVNFAGKTSFFELIALYSIAHILITNDSGPVHFSVMTDIKTFAFFGPETPKLYGPLGKNCRVFYTNYSCSPCISAFNHRKSPCTDNRCLQDITVEDVYAEVRKLIDRD